MILQPIKEGKIWQHKDKIIITDQPNTDRKDAVFPLCHENTYFIEKLKVERKRTVLDLCTGSGVLAIFAAENARKVYATDISARAIKFAKLNAKLNNLEQKIEFRQGNLFKPVKGMKFDLIIANPPFEPISKRVNYFTHSAGGKKGTDILEKILSNIENYLNLHASFQIITWIPKSKLNILRKIVRKNYKKVKIDTLLIFSPREMKEYLRKRTKANIAISEPVHYLVIQALDYNSCRK